ncbi:hypothetical protein [Methylobacterium oxalidis]|uniref:hypothetical protein n=1 Tax=Methylobacterium oxalidis TaxID=944322 RepID=UPI0011BDEB2E|nr:hypothetical protein [Methylobacterium oxalidis]GJE32694.1 hypothetical protein LDDCCGHA_2882 [Methylobacterium oxalidis]
MLLDRLFSSRCSHESERLQRAAHLHAISAQAVSSAARKTRRRVSDMKVTADAVERRARERGVVLAVEDVLRLRSFGGPGDGEG